MQFKRDLNDIVAQAIMNREPVIIVEGKDDHQIYRAILHETTTNASVYQVNEFENYGAGCDNVIKCIAYLQKKIEERPQNIQYILGIIDRDARPYRPLQETEINYRTLKGIFILKYYSIETYFATSHNLKKLLARLTYVSENDIPQTVVDLLIDNIHATFDNLYWISLEALRNACDTKYEAEIGYSEHHNGRGVVEYKAQQRLLSQILPKKEALQVFANDTIGVSIDDLKLICNGKWYLFNYIYHANSKMKELSSACKNQRFQQCSSCQVGNFEDCLYAMKTIYKNNSISSLVDEIQTFIDREECLDIIERIETLA